MKAARIALIGMMGSGKSTVAAVLAERLDWPLVDLDAVLEAKSDMSISEIFASQGEPAFRALEASSCLALLERQEQFVLALGGGAVENEATRGALQRRATVIWLRASINTLIARVGSGSARPLLGEKIKESMEEILKRREPFYEACADYVLDVDDLSPREVSDRIAVLTKGDR